MEAGADDNRFGGANARKHTLSSLALYSKPVLLQWAAWEAAQFCVSCKLRTPLGKPQGTFTTIEGVIKNLARDATSGGSWDAGRVRLLLDFVEQLEKVMYNAADGTATAIVAPSKVLRLSKKKFLPDCMLEHWRCQPYFISGFFSKVSVLNIQHC